MIFDLTQQFKNELSHYPQDTKQTYLPPKVSVSLKLYATYSEDIYQLMTKIRLRLAESRENYFSNASFSFEAFNERQREQFNQTVKANLQNVLSQINQLKEGLERQSDFRKKTQEEHMKAVVLCLYQVFKQIEATYVQFQEFSLKRKRKIQQTVSIDKQNDKGRYQTPSMAPRKRQVTDQQLQKESGMLIVQKISKQKELQQTKKQMENLHQLMSNMSNVVLQQELKTSAFLEIGETGLFHIQRGNKNLIEANILAKTTGKWWSMLFISMALSLLILDFLKS